MHNGLTAHSVPVLSVTPNLFLHYQSQSLSLLITDIIIRVQSNKTERSFVYTIKNGFLLEIILFALSNRVATHFWQEIMITYRRGKVSLSVLTQAYYGKGRLRVQFYHIRKGKIRKHGFSISLEYTNSQWNRFIFTLLTKDES